MRSSTKPIFFICNDPERALGLEGLLENFHIVCIDDNPIIDDMERNGAKVFSLERALGKLNPIFRNSNKLLQHEFAQKYIEENSKGETPNVMFFKIAPNIEKTCEDLGYKILNTSAELNRRFELKISQYEELKDADVNFPPTEIGVLGKLSYEGLVARLGDEFVIQYDRGHTGSSTLFVKDRDQFEIEKQKFPKRIARISQKINGDAWTINACVTRFGVAYGGLSYQITGVPELTSQEGGTVGNDWEATGLLEETSIKQIQGITENVGNRMSEAGFRGLFGLDFVIESDTGDVYLIEVNARQPASTGMHTKLMLKANLIPLQAFHMVEFLCEQDGDYLDFLSHNFEIPNGINLEDLIVKQNIEAIKPISASQVIVRNILGVDAFIMGEIKPGVFCYCERPEIVSDLEKSDEYQKYALDEHNGKMLIRIRAGYNINDVKEQEGFIILAQSKGHEVSVGGELLRIQAPFSLLDGKKLKPWVLKVLLGLKDHLLI